MEAILNTSFDWNGIRAPYIVATENDSLNGARHVVRLSAHEHGTGFCRRAHLLESGRGQAGDGPQTDRRGGRRISAPDQFRSGSAGRQRRTIRQRKTGNETVLGNHAAEAQKCLAATTWHPSITEYFPGGGWSTRYRTRGGMPVTICRLNLVKGLGPALQIAEGETVELPEKVHDALDERTNPTWPTTWFVPTHRREAARSGTSMR